MDAVGQAPQYVDVLVDSWTDALGGTSNITLRGPKRA
jgi:hypothetical protein